MTKPGGDYRYNLFINNSQTYVYWLSLVSYTGTSDFRYNVIASNRTDPPYNGVALGMGTECTPATMAKIKRNVFINNSGSNSFDFGAGWPMGTFYIDSNYWGTTDQNEIRKHIFDFFEDPQRPVVEPRNNLIKPPTGCHGVVWKVLINNQNPQEVATPIVVSGTVKFDVYFNRPMDVSVPPFVTFGVRAPFTQNAINNNASWSADSTVWTGYCMTTLKTGDGDNTVRVAFARDPDHFEIPIENERF